MFAARLYNDVKNKIPIFIQKIQFCTLPCNVLAICVKVMKTLYPWYEIDRQMRFG